MRCSVARRSLGVEALRGNEREGRTSQGNPCCLLNLQARATQSLHVAVNRRPEFRRSVAELRAQIMTEALGGMVTSMSGAANALATSLQDNDAAIRIRAARTILTVGQHLRDSVDLNERLRELEQEVNERQEAI